MLVSFTSRALRDAMGMFPTGVAVLTTTSTEGGLHGVTINSFNSVSLDPPLVLFSLTRSLSDLPAFLSAESYAVNILREDQRHISARFANQAEDKWRSIEQHAGVTGSPVLHPSLAVLECRHHAHYDGGDHIIFVGKVVHLDKPA
ncbi:MAG: flavin reductase family protein, partial [Bryobacteraceae bacterium]